jgi:uncharacterized protein YycO
VAAQIRPNRLEVTDRFPMLGFTIRTDGSPQRAEVALATDPSLFRADRKTARTSSNFYSSRAVGPLSVPRGEAVYVVPPEVLARFVGQERLYVGLATTPGGNGAPPRVDVMPGEGSPYILLKGLTGRSLRRVRLAPTRQDTAGGYGTNGASLEWAGDAATPGTMTATNGSTNGHRTTAPAAAPAPIPYDDGFGEMPPAPAPSGNGARMAPAVPAAPVAQALDLSTITVLAERLPVSAPSVTRLSDWQATLVQGALATFAGPLAPVVAALPAVARVSGVSIGVGPAVGAGLGAGAGLGVGVVFGPDGGVGVYGAAEFEVGFIASISATAQITIVRGGIESFNGWGMAAAISGGEGIVGGAAALFDMSGNFQGVSFQLGVGAGLTPIDFYIAIQRQVATQLAVAQAYIAKASTGRMPLPVRTAARTLSTDIPLDPGNGGMSIGSDALEVGDIIVSTTAAPISDLIRFGTGSQVSHAMLFVGQGGQVVDATGEGVRLRPLADALSDATLAVAFRYPGLADDQRMIIADKIAEQIGKPYNYWGIVRQARFQVHRALCDILPGAAGDACRNFYGVIDLGRGNSNEFFCSEVIVAAYQAAGVPITETPPIWSSPDDLVQLALKQSALVYVGHLKAPPYERRTSIWDSLGMQLATSRPMAARPRTLGVVRALEATRRPAHLPQARLLGPVEKGIALGTLAIVSPPVAAAVVAARAAANQFNVSIGIGPSVSAGFLEGGGAGVGIILAPGDQIGVYGQVDIRQGWIDSASIEVQCTVVNGGIDAFNGVSYAMAVEVDLGISVSVQALYDTSFNFQGVTFGFGAGGALEPIQVYMAVQNGIATQLAYMQAARPQGVARMLTTESFTVNWDEVEQIAQPTNVSCWAAAAAMVVGWHDQMSLPPEAIARISGRSTATGLDPAQVQQFATEMGLVFEYPQSYTVDGFRRLLESNGPLWIAASVPGLHAIVVTGMYSDGTNVYMRVTDPWDRTVGTPGSPGKYMKTHATGSRYILTWDDFVKEYEAAATGFSHVNLQVLHSGGVAGRTANYGGTTPPGYAQALRASRGTRMTPAARSYARAHAAAAPARRVESGTSGAVRWTLEQYDGLHRPPQMAAGAGATTTDRMVRLDDWPLVHPPEGEMQLPLTVAWRYNAGGVGDVAVHPGEARSIPDWTLAVTSAITEGPDTPATAALTVNIRHVFGRAGKPDIVGVSELTLFGDGTYARQDRWEQAEANVA